MKDKTQSTVILTVVLAIGLALVAQYGIHSDSVLAKSSSHKSKSSSSSGGSGSSSSSSSGGSSSSSKSSSSSSGSKSSSGKLKSLVSCETSTAKTASGVLNQNDVMTCFNQAYGNATGTGTGTSNSTTPSATATLH